MQPAHDDLLLGRLAIHYKLITRDQLVEALQAQSREGGQRRIGDILVDSGLVTRDRFEQLLEIQARYVAQQRAAAAVPAAPTAEATAASPPSGAAAAGAERRDAAPEAPTAGAADVAPQAEVSRELFSIEGLLEMAIAQSASDIHLHAGLRPRFRVAGVLLEIPSPPLAPEDSRRMANRLLSAEQQHELAERGQVDLAYTMAGVGRFRVNVYRQQRGTDIVLRSVLREPPQLHDLNLPTSLARLANYNQGMVLMTGPSGCGKTATLAALVRILNEERRDHIITIEDPVEIIHPPRRCVVNQRQVGRDTRSFARALKAALREDPDVIVIGELRDLETISLALTAAETGHLVLATLHTMSAIATINRLIGVFPAEQQPQIRMMVSESLRAVVSQRLVRRADGGGQVPALEILYCNRAVSNLIREAKPYQIRSVMQTGVSQGMCSLDASLEALVKAGTITLDEARLYAENPQRFAAPAAARGAHGQAG